MNIIACKVNHLKNPLGYHMEHVTFSYVVEQAKGKKQTAARIRVYTDKECKNVIYDSGLSSQISSIAYTIKIELAPCTRYYWNVEVHSDAGEEAVSSLNWFETAKQDEPWAAKWITCDSKEARHPIFSNELLLEGKVASARLYICGLGLYEVYLNGKKIGCEFMTPYSNDYQSWLQYQTYDITEDLERKNHISVLLGNGWYKSPFGLTASRTGEPAYSGNWKLIAEIHVLYEDGRHETFGTDENWMVSRSNILASGIYDGETEDATLTEEEPVSAELCTEEMAPLVARYSVPVSVHEELTVKDIIVTPAGETVIDLGQNMAGTFRLRTHVPRGTRVHLQFGEVLQNGNFYRGNLRLAKAEYIWVSDGNEHILQPHFTFYGYRYVKVEGIPDLKKEDFTGLSLYSEIEPRGELTTGNVLVNQLISNVKWGQKSNFLDVPTDCPQRNERLGWTGDAQVFCPTANYLTDCYAFFRKYLKDMAQEQRKNHGMVPDVIPSAGMTGCSSAWGDAVCIIPWILYLYNGDMSILAEQYESMKAWVDYITDIDGDTHGWRKVFHYGDWLALDHPSNRPDQTKGRTDEAFIADVYYRNSVQIVAKTANLLGNTADAEKYEALAEKILEGIQEEFFSKTGRCCIDTQTGYLLTLQYGLTDKVERNRQALVKALNDVEGQLRTGFIGTPLLCNVLSDIGETKMAYDLLLNEECPGWLYEVKMGATTVWERWNSILPDGRISEEGMNSLNHYAYGSIVEWMWRHMAGICLCEDAPGFCKVRLEPKPDWRIRSLKAKYASAAGTYEVAWKETDAEHMTVEVTVPFGCIAYLKLPYAPEELFRESCNTMFKNVEDGICILEAGSYEVSYKTTEYLRKVYSLEIPMKELVSNEKCRAILEQEAPMLMQLPKSMWKFSLKQILCRYGDGKMNAEMEKVDALLRDVE